MTDTHEITFTYEDVEGCKDFLDVKALLLDKDIIDQERYDAILMEQFKLLQDKGVLAEKLGKWYEAGWISKKKYVDFRWELFIQMSSYDQLLEFNERITGYIVALQDMGHIDIDKADELERTIDALRAEYKEESE